MDIIVVEGIHDEAKVKEVFPDASCIITNGSEISNNTINCIKELSKANNIIIFTDPDSPGERIRTIISQAVPSCKHAFLRKNECISNNKKKVGIEHASKKSIYDSLKNVYSNQVLEETFFLKDMYDLGLIGSKNSATLRDKLSNILNIGKPNAKTFLKRINLINKNRKDIEELLCQLK